MIRRPPRSTLDRSSAASDVYKRQGFVTDNFGRWYRLILPFGLLLSGLAAFLASQTLNARLRAERRSRQDHRVTLEQARLNERFALAAESAGIGVWELDLVQGTVVWDEWMHRLYRTSPGESISDYTAWLAHVHPEDRENLRAEIRHAVSGGGEPETDFRITWPTGEVRHLRAVARVIRDPSRPPIRFPRVTHAHPDRQPALLAPHTAAHLSPPLARP